MSFFKLDQLEEIHLELTSKCNALCPQCTRSIKGAYVNPNIKLTEITLEKFKSIFSDKILRQLKRIIFNGNHGDSAASNSLITILNHIKNVNPHLFINIHSNGGLRSTKWWQELADVLKAFGSRGHVVFGIDGLGKTNELYRVNVSGEKALENASAFINAGGYACWDFIVFKHNEHQIKKAAALSKVIGFKEFRYKKTGRFSIVKLNDFTVEGAPVYNSDGSFSHLLEMPENEDYINSAYENNNHKYNQEIKKHSILIDNEETFSKNRKLRGNFSVETIKKINDCEVSCDTIRLKSVFIDFQGHMFPCCYTAWPYFNYYNSIEVLEIRELLDNLGGYELLDVSKYTIEEVLNGPLFQYINNGLNSKGTTSRCASCSLTCGGKFKNLADEQGEKFI